MYMSAPVRVNRIFASQNTEWVEGNLFLFQVIVHFTEGNDDMLHCVFERICVKPIICKDVLFVDTLILNGTSTSTWKK